jgi:hypothetical protein
MEMGDRVLFTDVGRYPVEREGTVLEVDSDTNTALVIYEEYPGSFITVRFFLYELTILGVDKLPRKA